MTPEDPSAPPRRARAGPARDALALGGLLAVLAGGVAVGAWLGGPHLRSLDIAAEIEALGDWGPAAVILLMVVHCFAPFPAEILALGAGAAYGTLKGAALVWAGAMLGAALSFGLARGLGRAAVERLLPGPRRAQLDAWAQDQGAATLLISRFIPVIAFNLINYAAGLTRVGWWTFLWTTGLGILPLTLLMTHLGARMAELDWPWIIAVSVAGIAAIWAGHRFARRFTRR